MTQWSDSVCIMYNMCIRIILLHYDMGISTKESARGVDPVSLARKLF